MTTLFPLEQVPAKPRRRTPLVDIEGATWEKEIWHQFGGLFGWSCAHFRAVETKHRGYTVPVGAHGAGWPDFVMARDRVIYAEAKAGTGRVADKQKAWLHRLIAAGQEVYVFRPEYRQEIAQVLRARGPISNWNADQREARGTLLVLLDIEIGPTKGATP